MSELRCFVLVGMLTLGANAALLRAENDTCVHLRTCPEDKIDQKGCCHAAPDPDAGSEVTIMLGKPLPVSRSCPREMVHVAGAAFVMGSQLGDGEADEHPQHRVTLAGYCLDKTEVSAAAYAICVASGTCTTTPTAHTQVEGLCNEHRAERGQHPINCVDWQQATAYCAFVDKRLPSEAEWEYAAVGLNNQRYPWGNEAPSAARLNACGNECRALRARLGLDVAVMYSASDGWESTAPVDSLPRVVSPVGALHLQDNVSEWLADLYLGYDGAASAFHDGPHRVVRGGSFFDTDASRLRGASRSSANPRSRAVNVGFRCARSDGSR